MGMRESMGGLGGIGGMSKSVYTDKIEGMDVFIDVM
jgi:hypothetical protein